MTDQRYVVRKNLQNESVFKGKSGRLGHLDIELTERCNNACIHCYINLPYNDAEAKKRELVTNQWKDILKQAADLGALSVRLTGGEPLLREDFPEIYLFARRLGLKVMLFTNARLITPQLANMLADVPPLIEVEVSAYGMREESYAAVTCTVGGFEEFQRGVSLLLEKKIPFIVKSVLVPRIADERQVLEAWVKKIPWMVNQTPGYSVCLDLRARRDSAARNRLISDLRPSPEEVTAFSTQDARAYRRSMAQFCQNYLQLQGDRLFACEAGDSGCVDAYGNYQMCMLLRDPDVTYDLTNGSLREGLTEAFPRFREKRATNPDYLNRCARCFLKGLCEQCPGKSWAEHGTLDTPVEYLCQVAHAQAYFLGLLIEGEKAWEIPDWQTRIEALVQNTTVTD